eukprot:gene10774-13192_t
MSDKILLRDLHIQAVIGVNNNERNIKQNLIFNITVYRDLSTCGTSDSVHDTISYSTLSKSVVAYVESSHHYTLEALATGVARTCCLGFGIDRVKVKVEKPGALKLAKSPGVVIERTLEYFKKNPNVEIPTTLTSPPPQQNNNNNVYLALGSNIGDKFENILKAYEELSKLGQVVQTSFMYESLPQYYTDQDTFINCVCQIRTNLSPHQLLKSVKIIEEELGRTKTFRNGPRIIDIDILYYNNLHMKTDDLQIPHPLLWERDFVLVPLCDIAPLNIHPTLHITNQQMKINLKDGGRNLKKILKIGNMVWHLNQKTYIMGVLNVTPDSFSDGGQYNSIEKAMTHVEKLIADGSNIIDIGGQSTYPGAIQLGPEEELKRVLPIINAIRAKFPDFPLSIDTYHSSVAREALKAGCNVINDVSGGFKDPEIFTVARQFRVPIIINHGQPTPQFLQQQLMLSNSSGSSGSISNNNTGGKGNSLLPIYFNREIDNYNPDIIKIVKDFFNERVERAVQSGLYLWQIILDPGLGFSKTYEQSIEILRRGKELRSHGHTILIGPSRKGFIGATLAKLDGTSIVPDAKSDRRLWGTAACCCAASGWGVDIIRIHDVQEIRDSILISDSIYKKPF